MAAFEPLLGRDVADGGVQARGVIVVDEVAGDALGILQIQRRQRPDGLVLEGLVKALQLAVGLGGSKGWSSHGWPAIG